MEQAIYHSIDNFQSNIIALRTITILKMVSDIPGGNTGKPVISLKLKK